MPVAEDKLIEKTPFDVYAMTLILSFLFILGAILLLNDELDKHWSGRKEWHTPEEKQNSELNIDVAEHITKINDLLPEKKNFEVKITAEDRRDYPLIAGKDTAIPRVKELEDKYKNWVEHLIQNRIDINPGADNTEAVKNAPALGQPVLDKLRDEYKDPAPTPDVEPAGTGGAPPVPPAAPESPAAPAAPAAPEAPPAAPAPAAPAPAAPAP